MTGRLKTSLLQRFRLLPTARLKEKGGKALLQLTVASVIGSQLLGCGSAASPELRGPPDPAKDGHVRPFERSELELLIPTRVSTRQEARRAPKSVVATGGMGLGLTEGATAQASSVQGAARWAASRAAELVGAQTHALLGREPGPGEAAHLRDVAAQLERGASPEGLSESVGQALRATTEFLVREAVFAGYRGLLGREPTSAEVLDQTARTLQSAGTRSTAELLADVDAHFRHSPEHLTRQQVQGQYLLVLGREATPEEVSAWTTRVLAEAQGVPGLDTAHYLRHHFLHSTEWRRVMVKSELEALLGQPADANPALLERLLALSEELAETTSPDPLREAIRQEIRLTEAYRALHPVASGPVHLNGYRLNGTEESWVHFIANQVVPALPGTREERAAMASRVTWWALKEGVLDVGNPFTYSNCNTPGGDVRLGMLEPCWDGRAWQVGLSGVQVPGPSLEAVEAEARARHPGWSGGDVLASVAQAAGFGPGSGTYEAIVGSQGSVRKALLLRDPATAFVFQDRVVYRECISSSFGWCFGTWDTASRFAANPGVAQQVRDELYAYFLASAGGDP